MGLQESTISSTTTPAAPHLFWVALGGLATALAFPVAPIPILPPVALWPLAWIGLAPFLARLLLAAGFKDAAKTSLVFATAWFLVAGMWAFRVFDSLGWIILLVPIGWVVLFGVAAHQLRRAGWNPLWTWPLLWVAVEFVRSEWTPLRLDWLSSRLPPLRVSWLVLGHSRVWEPLFAQTADLWGGYGLSLAPFLTSLVIALAWANRRVKRRAALVLALLILGEVGYGFWAFGHQPAETTVIPVAVVQSERENLEVNIGLTESLWADAGERDSLVERLGLTRARLVEAPQTKLVVWPEASYSSKSGDLDRLRQVAREHDVIVIAGCELVLGEGQYQNLAYWVPPEGEVGTYIKHERIPFLDYRERPDQSFSTFSFRLDGSDVQAGVAICYDMDFPWNARNLVRTGAEFLAMPTMDLAAWGGTEHAQHSLLPRLRAVENRRPVVQAATSGVSQIIDAQGRVLASLPYQVQLRPGREAFCLEGTAAAVIQTRKDLSLYTRGGYLLAPAATVVAGILVVLSLFCRSRIPADSKKLL